jgi:hypothetical protein
VHIFFLKKFICTTFFPKTNYLHILYIYIILGIEEIEKKKEEEKLDRGSSGFWASFPRGPAGQECASSTNQMCSLFVWLVADVDVY